VHSRQVFLERKNKNKTKNAHFMKLCRALILLKGIMQVEAFIAKKT
jgi:hypothetical protein